MKLQKIATQWVAILHETFAGATEIMKMSERNFVLFLEPRVID